MNGVDPAQIAQNIITYLGGPAGGYLLAAALMVIGLCIPLGMTSKHTFIHGAGYGCLAWCVAWILRSIIAWA
jgi:hypothetical protein